MRLKIILILLSLFVAFPIMAKVGIGIYPSKLDLDEKVLKGKSYSNDQIWVRNSGAEKGTFIVELASGWQEEGFGVLEKDWIKIKPNKSFELEAGEARAVSFKLKIPKKASVKNKKIKGVILVRPVAQNSVGVAIGSKISFEIIDSKAEYVVSGMAKSYFGFLNGLKGLQGFIFTGLENYLVYILAGLVALLVAEKGLTIYRRKSKIKEDWERPA